jgi:hypothetical protein
VQRRARIFARAKLLQELQLRKEYGRHRAKLQEQSVKHAREAEQKLLKEEAAKQADLLGEAKQKEAFNAQEQVAKNELSSKEEGDKSNEHRTKASEADEKKRLALARAQTVLVNKNTPLAKGQQIALNSDLKQGRGYSYMFWIFPRTKQSAWASILHKGSSNDQRNPAIFFFPDSLRLHVRSGVSKDPNAGVDLSTELPAGQWTHIALAHSETELLVYLNGKEAAKVAIGAPLTNSGPLYLGDPWYDAADAIVTDLRYHGGVASPAEVAAAFGDKRYSKVETGGVVLKAGMFRPRQNQVVAEASKMRQGTEYSLSFWINPRATDANWCSILHKGAKNEERNPAIFFNRNTTSLHVRSGTKDDWNAGTDVASALSLGRWTHVAATHRAGAFTVYLDGLIVHLSLKIGAPLFNAGPLYGGAPWYRGCAALVTDVRYDARVMSQDEIKALVQAGRSNVPMIAPLVLRATPTVPAQGKAVALAKDLAPFRSWAWTVSFWIKPTQPAKEKYANVFHHGAKAEERSPAVFFYPNSTRLRIRSGTARAADDGVDPDPQLALNKWTHVAFSHADRQFTVFFDGEYVVTDESLPEPQWKDGNVWLSNPWDPAADCVVSDLRFYDVPLVAEEVRAIMKEEKR